MKKTVLILLILLVLTVSVRLAVALNTYIMTDDGPFYLNTACKLAGGDYKEILTRQIFHPLYPFLIAVTHIILNPILNINWEWAGMLVSILFSAIAVIPLYFISRRYFTDFIVITACLLYAFHHRAVELSASVFTTGVFIGIFLFAVWVTIIALESNRYRYFLLSGLLSFIMYLVRPDGVVFLAISIIGCAVSPFRTAAGNKSVAKKIIAILMLIIPWLCLMPPYLSAHFVYGGASFTNKVSIKKISGFSGGAASADKDTSGAAKEDTDIRPPDESSGRLENSSGSSIKVYFNGLYLLAYYFIKGANPVLLLLLLIGVVGYFRKSPAVGPGPPNRPVMQPGMTVRPESASRGNSFFIWLVFITFTLVFLRYAIIYGRLSTRYTVPLLIMVMAWAGNGLYYISAAISRLIKSQSGQSTGKIYYGLLILVIVFFSFYTFRPVRKFKIIEKTTGELLNKYHLSRTGMESHPAVIITKMQRLAYYAGGVNIIPDGWSRDNLKTSDIIESLKDAVKHKDADYIVLDGRLTRDFPDLEKELINLGGDIKAEPISQYFSGKAGEYYRVYRFATPDSHKK